MTLGRARAGRWAGVALLLLLFGCASIPDGALGDDAANGPLPVPGVLDPPGCDHPLPSPGDLQVLLAHVPPDETNSGLLHLATILGPALPAELKASSEPVTARVAVIDLANCEPVMWWSLPMQLSQERLFIGETTWDGTSALGVPLRSGRYLIVARADDVGVPAGSAHVLLPFGEEPCAPGATGSTGWHDLEVPAGSTPVTLKLPPSMSGHFCIELQGAVESVWIDDQLLAHRPVGERLVISYPGRSDVHELLIRGPAGPVRVGVLVPELPIEVPAPPPRIPEQAVACEGQLRGFRDPFTSGPPRRIARAGVKVVCEAKFRGSSHAGVMEQGRVTWVPTSKIVRAEGESDEDGRFRLEMQPEAFAAAGIDVLDTLTGFQVGCPRTGAHGCGNEWTPQSIRMSQFPTTAVELDVSNVPDLVVGSLAARLVTKGPIGGRAPHLEAGTSEFGAAHDPQKPNDLPVVLHEPFDPLLEDGTDHLYWLLAGQPWDHRRVRRDDREPTGVALLDDVIPPGMLCDGASVGACVGCRHSDPSCRSADPNCWRAAAEAEGERFHRLSFDVMTPLLDAGYDVWLVDHMTSADSILTYAMDAPRLYQAILDFPIRDLMPIALAEAVAGGAGRPRQLAVGGLSAGGLVARIALRAWELGNDLPAACNLQEGRAFDLALTDAEAIVDSPERVALYASFDSPHLGGRIPVTFQGLVKDDRRPSETNFRDLMNHGQAEELLTNYVAPPTRSPCLDGDGDPRDCGYRPDHDSLTTSNARQEALRRCTMELFDAAADEQLPHLEPDGLPKTVPGIAFANGSFRRAPANPPDNKVIGLKVDRRSWIGAPAPALHLRLFDGRQVQGSGLGQICRVWELDGITESRWACVDGIRAGAGLLGTIKSVPVLGLFNPAAATLAAAAGGFLYCRASGTIRVDYVMSPSADPDLGYPTFIPTASALLLRSGEPDEPARRWRDAYWDMSNDSHFAVKPEHCQGLLFHLDGYMKGDRDGWPSCSGLYACGPGLPSLPGRILDPRRLAEEVPERACEAFGVIDPPLSIGPLLPVLENR